MIHARVISLSWRLTCASYVRPCLYLFSHICTFDPTRLLDVMIIVRDLIWTLYHTVRIELVVAVADKRFCKGCGVFKFRRVHDLDYIWRRPYCVKLSAGTIIYKDSTVWFIYKTEDCVNLSRYMVWMLYSLCCCSSHVMLMLQIML